MRRLVTATTIVTLATLAACGGKPAREAAPSPAPTAAPTPVALAIPLANREIGISLGSLPDDLVAIYNSGSDLMLVERSAPDRRIFVESKHDAGPLDPPAYFQQALEWAQGYGGGEQLATGTVADTPFGPSAWTSARFWEDGARYDQVELASPHPSGKGLLLLRSVYPDGTGDPQAKLEQLEDLLGHISPAG